MIRQLKLAAELIVLASLLVACSFTVVVDGQTHYVQIRGNALTTPTSEQNLPTVVPTTPHPTTEKGICQIKTMSFAIRERVAPSTRAALTPSSPVDPNSIVVVEAFTEAEGYLWARSASGWFAVKQNGEWWIQVYEPNLEWCRELPGWPTEDEPSFAQAAVGIWVGPGANRFELLEFGERIKAAGLVPAAVVYGEPETARILHAAGWLVAVRSIHTPDCPDVTSTPAESAEQFLDRIVADVGTEFQIVVGANECYWSSAEWLVEWLHAFQRRSEQHRLRAVIPVVWNPGTPDLAWTDELMAVYRTAKIAMLWGLNVYPVEQNVGLSTENVTTRFTTFRHRLYDHTGVGIFVTEFARGDGSESPDFFDVRRWWQKVKNEFVAATAWYVAGDGFGNWQRANMRGRLNSLAEAFAG